MGVAGLLTVDADPPDEKDRLMLPLEEFKLVDKACCRDATLLEEFLLVDRACPLNVASAREFDS